MSKFKITVLKRIANQDLADKYCVPEDAAPCPYFTDGQEFIVESNGRQPEDFCGWAWNDIHKSYLVIRHGGGFSGWMKDQDTIIACCTDGIRPVVFEVKKLDSH